MTIGYVLAGLALGAAFAAAAARGRRAIWTYIALGSSGTVVVRAIRPPGVDLSRIAATPDDYLYVLAILMFAAMIFLRFGLPEATEARLRLRKAFPEWQFDRTLTAIRWPFEMGLVPRIINEGDDVDVHWRRWLTISPPTAAWGRLTDQLERSDAEWADLLATGGSVDAWLRWTDEYHRLRAELTRLRAPLKAGIAAGAKRSTLGAVPGLVVAAICFSAASLQIPDAAFTNAPVGRAPYIPEPPAGRIAYFAAIGGFPDADIDALVAFYEYRYEQPVNVLPPTPLPDWLLNQDRRQTAAEDVIELIRTRYPEAADPNAVVIGIVPADIYIRAKTDWSFAFGLRSDDHLAIISTARMQTLLGSFGDRLEASRLRKMVTKDLGLLLWGLPSSPHPRSVMYSNILGVSDLDAMAEDF